MFWDKTTQYIAFWRKRRDSDPKTNRKIIDIMPIFGMLLNAYLKNKNN